MASIRVVDSIPIPNKPIYFYNEYLELFSEYEGTDFIIYEFETGGKKYYLPLLVHQVSGYKELFSSYGYGGVISLGPPDDFLEIFEHFLERLSMEGVVDIFLRNTPFLSNEIYIPEKYNTLNRMTYLRELGEDTSLDILKGRVSQSVRWALNHALKNNLKVEFMSKDNFDERVVHDFYNLYLRLMKEKETSDFYYFSESFFKKHFEKLPDNCELAYIHFDGTMIAGAMFLLDNLYVHYHFSAVDRSYSKLQPMDLLLSEAIVRYTNKGKKYFHFGGGLSLEGNDGLSRFKKKFSTMERKFYLSKIIVQEQEYISLRRKYNVLHSDMFLIRDALRWW